MNKSDLDSMVSPTGVLSTEAENLIIHAFNVLSVAAQRNSAAHGFHDKSRPFSEEIALIHSEASEALEEWRDGREFGEVHYTRKIQIKADPTDNASLHPKMIKVQVPAPQFEPDGTMNKPEGIGAEFADIVIRVADSSHGRENLGVRVIEKHKFNIDRPHMNGGKIA